MVWFCFLSFILTSPKLNFLFKKYDVQIEKFSSAFLVFIGLLIIFNTFLSIRKIKININWIFNFLYLFIVQFNPEIRNFFITKNKDEVFTEKDNRNQKNKRRVNQYKKTDPEKFYIVENNGINLGPKKSFLVSQY